MGHTQQDVATPLKDHLYFTASQPRRSRVGRSQTHKMWKRAHVSRGVRRARLAYLPPRTSRRQAWNGWRPSWAEIINGISFILILGIVVIGGLLLKQIYGGRP